MIHALQSFGQTSSQPSPVAASASANGLRSLTDIAEELPMGQGDRTQSRRLTERHIDSAPAPRRLTPAELVELLTDANEAATQAKLLELARYLARMASKSHHELSAGLEASLTTPVQQYAVLKFACDNASILDVSHQGLTAMKSLCAQYEREHNDTIRHTFGALPFAHAYAAQTDPDARAQGKARHALIAAYGGALDQSDSLFDVLDSAVKRLAPGTLTSGLAHMVSAAGHELVTSPPHDTARLSAAMRQFGRLGVLAAALDECLALSQQLSRHHSITLNTYRFVGDLVTLLRNAWPNAQQFQDLGRSHASDSLPASIQILRTAREVCQAIPVHLHDDDQARDRLKTAAQQALDTVIEKEESQA